MSVYPQTGRLDAVGAPRRPIDGLISMRELLILLAVLAAVREPLGIPLHFKFFVFLIAAIHLAGFNLHRLVLWAAPMLMVANLAVLINGTPLTSILRLQMVTALVLFASFVAMQPRESLIRALRNYLLPIIVLTALAELALGTERSRDFQSFTLGVGFGGGALSVLPRLSGINGEPNYSGLLLAMLSFTFFAHKERVAAGICLVIMFLTFSRGAVLALAVAMMIYHVPINAIRVAVAGFFGAIFAATPGLVAFIDDRLDPNERAQLIIATTRRWLHWTNHKDFGADNLFGVGYFQAEKYYADWAGIYISQFFSARNNLSQQAHNFMLSIWAELGPITFVAMCLFVGYLFVQAARRGAFELGLFALIMVGYMLLNGVSDWIFWFAVGLLLSAPKGGVARAPA